MVQSVAGDAGYHVTRYNNFWYGRILIVSGVPRGVWGFNRPPPKFQRPSKIVPNGRILTVSGVPRGVWGVQTPRNSEGPPKLCQTEESCQWRTEGDLGVQLPPEIPKSLQNCAKRKDPDCQWRTEGGQNPPKFRRPSKIVPNSTRL